MKVVGLDLSLTSTGVAVATERGAVTDRIRTSGHLDDPFVVRSQRLAGITGRIVDHVRGADLVVVEGPAYSKANQGTHQSAGLWWLVLDHLRGLDLPIAVVAPNARARYATGRGNAAKDDVLAAVVRRYPAVDVAGNDEADALVLAAMGARRLGRPLEPALSIPQLAAMDKVTWPDDTRVGAA